MKIMRRLGLAGLLVAIWLALASCGAGGGSASPSAGENPQDGGRGAAQNGEHSGDDSMGHGNGSEGQPPGKGHPDTDHGRMGGEETARRMLEDEEGNYSDRRFIDEMVPHHQGAVEMAEVALEDSGRKEILDLSRDIARTQNAEIDELKAIKEEEFGTSEVPMNMGEDDMEMMGMTGPEELARQRPFDRAFIDAMIPHHQSAIDMANVVLEESENPALRGLATDIVEAQEREIAQMKEWREEWYPKS